MKSWDKLEKDIVCQLKIKMPFSPPIFISTDLGHNPLPLTDVFCNWCFALFHSMSLNSEFDQKMSDHCIVLKKSVNFAFSSLVERLARP